MGIIYSTVNIGRVFRSGGENVHALRNVSISIEHGKLTLLRGRSGSGKTTLINILGALDRPDEGSVFFMGEDISKSRDSQRDALRRTKMGFVFQSVALVGSMNVFDNVEFGLRIAGCPGKERRRQVKEALEIVGLEARAYHMTQELSGGEQQRVAIARGIVHRPAVLFADEPTAELDTTTGLRVISMFKKLIEHTGLTVIMATHDLQMMELGDVVYHLEDGAVIETDD